MNIINLSLFKAMTQNMAKTLLVAVTLSAATHSATATTRTFDEASANNSMKDAASNASGFRNLDEVVGLTLDKVKKNAVDAEKYPEDMDKIFFLYNVKTGMFINTGGYWGTHISLKDYPISLWVNTNSKYGDSTIELAQNLDTGIGHLLGWVGGTDTTQPDNGVFIDRRTDDDTHYGWTFEPVNDTQHTYRIYTYTTKNPTTSGESQSTKFYLCANKGSVDQDKNCGAFSEQTISSENLSGYDTWRIMSRRQIFELQKLNSDDMTSPLDVSYKLKCPGLSRGNKDIDKWNINTFGGNGGVRYGLERMYNKTNKVTSSGTSDTYDVENISTDKSYTFEDTKYTDKRNYLRHMAKYFCVDAKNIRGAIYQDVKVLHSGSYIVECKGYSNTPKAKLFAVRLDKDGKEVARTVHQTVLSQVSYMSEAEKEALHVDEQNMDYAGKEFYGSRKYINSVLVQIPEQADGNSDGNYGYIRFGVIVGDDAADKQPVDGEWTVFDDFRLLYASRTIDEDLILDEDRSDLSYLTTCKNNYKNKVLHLKKSFTRDKWNSIVLPVKLTRDQFRQAFGANAKLAKLTSLTSDEIQFTSIDMNSMTTNDVVLDAYTPYIFFPTKYIAKNETPAYKALLTETGTEAKSHELVISDNHIEIPNITFEMNSKNENDLSNIDTDTWTTKKMYSVGGNGTMEAHGTFVRTFGTDAEQDLKYPESFTYGEFTIKNHEFFTGRDNLIKSFFFYEGKMYYSNNRPHGLRGFNCWFKPTDGTLVQQPIRLYLDGVANGTTTNINTVLDFEKQNITGKAVKGIFNLNGQRISDKADTTGLPAGMYIVNGKKCIIK